MFYVIGAYLLDLLIGELRFLKLPIKLLEVFVAFLEKMCVRTIKTQEMQKLFGAFIVAVCVFVPFFITLWILMLTKSHKYLFIFLNVYFLFLAFSNKSLSNYSKKIYKALKKDDLAGAKLILKKWTGKNTDFYTKNTVIRVCIENTAKGIVEDITAPMFYAFIGGAPVAFLYRTSNILGKRMDFEDENFIHIRHLGTILDDILTYIPTRMTALVMYLSSICLKLPRKRFFVGLYKDVKKKISLNDVYPQSIIAGRLGILLGNGAGGVSIGEYKREIRESDILKAVSMMQMTAFLFALISCLLMAWKLFL